MVAATIIIPELPSKPSISVKSWFNVCSLSSFPPPIPAPLCLPTASISSINTIQGAFFLACSKRSLTLLAPTPTNISTNSEPDIEKKGTPASPATALANNVFPVPGGPTRRTPFGIFAPTAVNLSGLLRKSTTSVSSNFAPSTPATSEKVTCVDGSIWSLALLLPKLMAGLPPPALPLWDLLKRKNRPPIKSTGKIKLLIACCHGLANFVGVTAISTLFSVRIFNKSLSGAKLTSDLLPSFSTTWAVALSGDIRTLLISLSCTASIKSLYLKVFVELSVLGLSKTEVPMKITVITART